MATGRLKFIELENYKSYKGRQVIGPFKPFTAVIGPNGSGKSNLMDAISFVLGDQTRNLRVRRLGDLIHGAVVGKPAAKSASVTAVYESIDGVEWRFSRHIHGNASEYRINGQSVRIDEYSEALEKIQIFMKVKNFLVFQGAVESIAMKNAKERCQMFEEISKSNELKEEYEKAKEEMHALEEEANFNLNKKKGIVAERKEARMEIEEAEKFKKLSSDLDAKTIELHLFKLYHNDLEMKHIREELTAKEASVIQEHDNRQNIEEEMKDKKKELARLGRDTGAVEQEIRKCEQKIAKKKPEHIKVTQRLKHLAEKHKESKKALEEAKTKHLNHVHEIEQLEIEMDKVSGIQREYEEEVSRKSQAEGKDLELQSSQLQEYYNLKQKVGERTSHISSIVDQLKRDLNEQKDTLDALERRKQEIGSSQKRKESELSETNKRLRKLIEYIEQCNKSLAELKESEESIRTEVDAATVRTTEIETELQSVMQQLGEARVERLESSRATRKQELIENLKRLFPGVYGRLMEMCQPSHRRYQIAVTKVLGKYMDAIVCDSEKTAKECIQYMKDQRIEPETFLPLDYLDVRPIDERLREISEPPNVYLVIDVIQYDPPVIKKALQFALGNALVCESNEHARRVAFNMGERKKTVSLEGTLFQRSGIISGGASDLKARARRWDEKQINGLVAKREALQEELKEQVKKKRKMAELRTIESQIRGLEMRIKYTEKDRNTTEERMMSPNSEEITKLTDELKDIEMKIERCQARIQDLQMDLNTETGKMDTVEDDVFRDFCAQIGVTNIRQYEQREMRSAFERQKRKLEFVNKLQKLENQLEYERTRDTAEVVRKWENTVSEERGEMEDYRKQEKRIQEELSTEEARIVDLEAELSEHKKRRESLESELSEVRRRLGQRQKEIQRLQKEITQIEAKLDSRRAERHSLLQSAKMDDLELPFKSGSMADVAGGETQQIEGESQTQPRHSSHAESSEEMNRIYEKEARLVLDYRKLDKSLRQITEEKDVAKKRDELQSKVDQMAASLARIQAPNLRANVRLGTVEERLRSTEAEFEETRRRAKRSKAQFERQKRLRHDRFMKCFNVVADNIDSIYKLLSRNPGAQASLLPTNPEEPYLEEIQFQCVAPGKRFQQMDSLSGGEKTVAALALLFATHSFNPAPFFVLDEIDAALDNTNISKVAKFIREYSRERAQIIVISLKEEFYGRADALIGIYPDVENSCLVSRVLSLDLTTYRDEDD